MSRSFLITAVVIIISASLSANTISETAKLQIAARSMKIQQQFSVDLEKLLDFTGRRMVRKFEPIWAKNVEVFHWADYNINSDRLMSLGLQSSTGDIVVTGAYVLEDATMAVGGYFGKTGEPIIIANKAFQFKAKTKRVTYFEPKDLRGFTLQFSHLHKQRDVRLRREAKRILFAEKLRKSARQTSARIRKTSAAGTVEAISIQGQTASVMINNRLLAKNDLIDGIKITGIKPNKVTFERDGQQWTQAIGKKPTVKW